MNDEKKYNEALERARKLYEQGTITESLCYVFPELKESEDEDERIRKVLKEYFINSFQNNGVAAICGVHIKDILAWLEKQGSEPNWCHHKVDLSNCSEEYCKAYYDGWNNCNMQHSQCRSELDDVVKCLINGMKFYYEDNEEATWGTDKWSMPVKHIIEVLEKQDKQKPADKVEPKFKMEKGKWYVCDTFRYTDFIVGKAYYCPKNGMLKPNENAIARYVAKDCFHLWTIQDAKDGDVLATENFIFIFKNIDNGNGVHYYCHYEISKHEDDNQFGVALPQSFMGRVGNSISRYFPATKEQRDLLFQTMKEAGYEWDADKKELKKIEQKPLVIPKFRKGDFIRYKTNPDDVERVDCVMDDYYILDIKGECTHVLFTCQDLWELVEQNPAWSEEDEKILNLIIARLHSHPNVEVEEYGKDYHWLNSLENRVQPQPKQEWSEEDEETLKDIITSMTNLKDSATSDALRYIYNSKIAWLKSIRPQSHWKPSDEQMDALKSSTYCPNKQMSKVLFGLYQDLLKLRE